MVKRLPLPILPESTGELVDIDRSEENAGGIVAAHLGAVREAMAERSAVDRAARRRSAMPTRALAPAMMSCWKCSADRMIGERMDVMVRNEREGRVPRSSSACCARKWRFDAAFFRNAAPELW